MSIFSNIYWGLKRLQKSSVMSGNTRNIGLYLKLRVYLKNLVILDILGYLLPDDFQNRIGWGRVLIKIHGSGSGSGTRWALQPRSMWGCKYLWQHLVCSYLAIWNILSKHCLSVELDSNIFCACFSGRLNENAATTIAPARNQCDIWSNWSSLASAWGGTDRLAPCNWIVCLCAMLPSAFPRKSL